MSPNHEEYMTDANQVQPFDVSIDLANKTVIA